QDPTHHDLCTHHHQPSFFKKQICLPIARLCHQNRLQHFNRTLRILFDFSLRLHHADGRGRNVEETFLSRSAFRDLRTSQQLAAREKLRLLPEDLLQERNRVTEIAHLHSAPSLPPKHPH